MGSGCNGQGVVLTFLALPEKKSPDDQPVPRKKYTPASKAECVRQVAADARQRDIARAQGISPALLGSWQRATLEQAVPSSAEREDINRLRAKLKRAQTELDIYDDNLYAALVVSKYLFSKVHADTWGVSNLCRVLGVSHSGCYQWRAAAPPLAPA